MAGGILLSSNFLHQFSKKIDVLSLMNQDVKKNNQLFKLIKNKKNLIFSKSFSKILKERFIQTEKNTVSKKKLLTLNHFENKIITNQDETKILFFLRKNLKKYDIVIVQDFGHGLINKKIANYISEKSNFLSINVQSNSTNFGFNIINQKFKKADLFVIDENEIQLYSKKSKLQRNSENLKKDLNSSFAFLTRGEIYSLLIQEKNKVLKLKSLRTKSLISWCRRYFS